MPIKHDSRQYRSMAIPMLPAQQKRIESDYYVEGYATTFNQPYLLFKMDGVEYYEQIDRGALDGADMSDVILRYDHEGKVLARQRNNTLIVEADNTGLFTAADLSKSEAARGMHEEIKSGLIDRMSWAFTVQEESYDKENHLITIRKIKKVYDVAPVSIPANDATSISARSRVNGVIDQEAQELRKRQQRILAMELKIALGGK